MFLTVPTQSTFTRVTAYNQCLSYHESKFFLDHMVVYVKNKLAVLLKPYLAKVSLGYVEE